MKKLILTLCMLACILSFSACQSAGEEPVDSQNQQMLEEVTRYHLESFADFSDADIEAYFAVNDKEDLQSDAELLAYNAILTWKDIRTELGDYIEIIEVSVKRDENGYIGVALARFEKREMEFTVSFNRRLTDITGFKFEPQYSVGEKMQKAAMNTLLGMGTVFLVLIFMIFIIGGFKHINKMEAKIRNKKEAPIESVPAPPKAPPVQETVFIETEDVTDDLALVAVITAAIAAAADVPADGLVVRSIRRASTNKWKRA